MTQTTKMQIEHLPIEDLRHDPANPRRISDEELESLTRSIREFGLVDPIIARQEDKTVIGGHQRLLAARRLGLTQVPVVLVDLVPGAGPAAEPGVESHQWFLGPRAVREALGRVSGSTKRGPDPVRILRG